MLLSPAFWYVPAVMLLIAAVAPMPYGYYTLLRCIVCGACIVLAGREYRKRAGASGGVVGFAGLAVLINPLISIPLTREVWAPVSFGAAIVLVLHRIAENRASGLGARARSAPAPPNPTTAPTAEAVGRTGRPGAPRPERGGVGGPSPAKSRRANEQAGAGVERGGRRGAARGRAAPDSNVLAAGSRLHEYEIVRVLGAGGFGITYLAFDSHLNGPVALKEYFFAGAATRGRGGAVLPSAASSADEFQWGRDRFLDEARLLARLDRHPNLVRVHRYFEANNTAYIVMDYVEGESLAAVLTQHAALTPEQWRPWMMPLLAGLEHVHRHNYLHRDIKPANIVVRADANGGTTPVLIDFGAARRAAGDKTVVHTPGYAPIEQYSPTSPQGPATDIYALAAVAYRVLAGECPPDAPDRTIRDRYRPLVTRLERPRDRFLAAIDRALALRADDRPQSIQAWRRELTAESPSRRAVPEAPPGRTPSRALLTSWSPSPLADGSWGAVFRGDPEDLPADLVGARIRVQTSKGRILETTVREVIEHSPRQVLVRQGDVEWKNDLR